MKEFALLVTHSLKTGMWFNVRYQDGNEREELEYGQGTSSKMIAKWGTMDFP